MAENKPAMFYDLQNIFFKHILKQTFQGSDFDILRKDIRDEYAVLRRYIKDVFDTLKNRNDKIIVKVIRLGGEYLLYPNFKKLVQREYCYRQFDLVELNETRQAIYNGQLISLNEQFEYHTKERLVASEISPYVNGKESKLQKRFEEESTTIVPQISNPKDIVSKSNALFSLYNQRHLDEYDITLDDMYEVLDKLGHHDIIVSQDGNQFSCNQMVDSEYFDCSLTQKNRIRVRIESLIKEEKVINDVDYFFEELEGKYFLFKSLDDEQTEKVEIEIKKAFKTNQMLIIKRKDGADFDDTYNYLEFDIALSNLKKQLRTLDALLYNPREVNRNLLKIVFSQARYDNPEPKRIDKFFFLKDDHYQGTKEQRDFVCKAIATEDFMLLAGPPGTGKTTAIMEFICQALKGKSKTKILLSASTHVAIDNVIENLMAAFGESLHTKNIFPIRLGTAVGISDKADVFNYEKIKDENGEAYANLYLKTANLVCGTTMGIQRYLVTETERYEFDYLVIDEASKTQLQEFIVPASMCHKYILVGDVHQLSPYTDTFMLETLLKSNPKLTVEYQDFAYNNFVLQTLKRTMRDPFIVVLEKESTIKKLKKEIEESFFNYVYRSTDIEFLYDNKSVVMSKNMYLNLLPVIPKFFKNVLTTAELPYSIKEGLSNKLDLFIDQTESLRERIDSQIGSNWAKEVAWRLVRFHELGKENKVYARDIDDLLPKDELKIRKDIEDITDITIPSILTKLQEGIKVNDKGKKNRFRTGFLEDEKRSRFVQLIYQHRMHSSIAKYAETSIYFGNLKTAQKVDEKREKYQYYRHHNMFINVKNPVISKKENEREAIEIVRIIKDFIEKPKDETQLITIGVLTFYRAQEEMIRRYMNQMLESYHKVLFNSVSVKNIEIELFTVDKFQGKESDISIISLTRNKGRGFLNVPNRINVAMTRAKYYRIVVGDNGHFSSLDELFLKNITDAVVYMEGELT